MLSAFARSGDALPASPDELILPVARTGGAHQLELDDAAQVCSCNNVSKGAAVRSKCKTAPSAVGDLKDGTKAGTGLRRLRAARHRHHERRAQAPRQERQQAALRALRPTAGRSCSTLVRVRGYRSVRRDRRQGTGAGDGCEICKPAVASILASLYNELILDHDTLQDTNDRFLANIQRGGMYSVVPRIPGGEITPDKLIALGAGRARSTACTPRSPAASASICSARA